MPYNYGPIEFGLIIPCFGIGFLATSVGGGWWSDRTLQRLGIQGSERNADGKNCLGTASKLPAMPFFRPVYLRMLGWHITSEYRMLPRHALHRWLFLHFGFIGARSPTCRNSIPTPAALQLNSSSQAITGLIIAEISVPLQVHL